jgi:3-(3-hydroxy-phenyl)propionate hydroxylase
LLLELGASFTLMVYGADVNFDAPCHVLHIQPQHAAASAATANILIDRDGLIAKRYDLQLGTAYLLRPDQHVCARWRQATPAKLQAALNVALDKIESRRYVSHNNSKL